MTPFTGPLSCRSRNERPQAAASGYALLTLMIMVAVLLITITAALPSVYQGGQREREAEAIFDGNQYARAVYLYYRRFGHYPTSVKDLLNTDGARFLRRPYRDPLARNGRWRFVHAAAGGILVDSWNQTTTLLGRSPGAGTIGGMSAGNSTSATAAGNPPGSAPGATTTTAGKPKHPPSTCDSNSDESSDQFAGATYQTGTLMGAYIVGVAPCSGKQSIRVLDHQDHYDHWEFLGLNYQEYGLPRSALPGTQPAGTAGSQFSTPSPVSNGQAPSGTSTPQP